MADVVIAGSLVDALQRLPGWDVRDEDQETLVRSAILDSLQDVVTGLPEAVRKLDAEVA